MGFSTKVSHLIKGGTTFPTYPYQGQSVPEWTSLNAFFYDLLDRRGIRQAIEEVKEEDWFHELEPTLLQDISELSPPAAVASLLGKLDSNVSGFSNVWGELDEETKSEIIDVGTSIILRVRHDPESLPDVKQLYQRELKIKLLDELDKECRKPSDDWMLDEEGQVPMAIYRAMKRGVSVTLGVLEKDDYILIPYVARNEDHTDILTGITDLFNDISS